MRIPGLAAGLGLGAGLFAASACEPPCEYTLDCGPQSGFPETGGAGAGAMGGATTTGGGGGGELGGGGAGGDGGGTPVSAVAVSTGFAHACAVLADGRAKCWGDNDAGQLGDLTTTGSSSATEVALDGISAIACGGFYTCALRNDQTVWCWGKNQAGQLGNGTTTDNTTPAQVASLQQVGQVSAGYTSAFARTTSSTALGWGRNNWGQLGNNTTMDSLEPTLAFQANVAEISTGGATTCARLSSGSVACWGFGFAGELGNAEWNNSPTPVPVSGLVDSVDLDVSIPDGGNSVSFACAAKTDGSVVCWGDNTHGELGNGSTTAQNVPTQVTGLLSGAVEVASGVNHACARLNDGTVRCWGEGTHGELGNAADNSSTTPVQVHGLSTATSISAGAGFTCVTTSEGPVMCWGGVGGVIGNGNLNGSNIPLVVQDL